MLHGTGEVIPGHRVPAGTDLEVAYDLQRDDLVLRVNKGGVLVFRAMLRDVAKEIPERELVNFNSFAPGLVLTIGDMSYATPGAAGAERRACSRDARNGGPAPRERFMEQAAATVADVALFPDVFRC